MQASASAVRIDRLEMLHWRSSYLVVGFSEDRKLVKEVE